jgi:hypothetical protein
MMSLFRREDTDFELEVAAGHRVSSDERNNCIPARCVVSVPTTASTGLGVLLIRCRVEGRTMSLMSIRRVRERSAPVRHNAARARPRRTRSYARRMAALHNKASSCQCDILLVYPFRNSAQIP